MKYSKKVQNHIKRAEGQVGSVRKMIVNGDEDDKVMIQLQASISSLESLKTELVKEQMKKAILENVKSTLEAQ
ncbi:MAG TPA: metal-sensing transcriptional repressor [Candidatus Dojkabacteria bacterium]|nr:metal-sensing transcriptional repressor [Candidatus Dojkabacteria bacterium]